MELNTVYLSFIWEVHVGLDLFSRFAEQIWKPGLVWLQMIVYLIQTFYITFGSLKLAINNKNT